MLVDQQARNIAVSPIHSVISRAPAGSGKTGVLLLRFLNCLALVDRPEAVLATTFTNKGANEMRERVIDALRDAAEEKPVEDEYGQQVRDVAARVLERDEQLGWHIIDNPARLRVCTFDTFCASLAKRLPILSGLGAGAIEENPTLLYRQAIIELLAQIDNESAPDDLKSAISAVMMASKNRAEDLIPLLSNLLANRDQWMYEMVAPDVDSMEDQLEMAVSHLYDSAVSELMSFQLDELCRLFAEGAAFDTKLAWASPLSGADLSDMDNLPLVSRVAQSLLTSSGRIKIRSKVTARDGFPAKKGVTADINAMLGWLSFQTGALESLKVLRDLPSPQFSDSARELIGHFSVLLRHLLAHLQLAFEKSGKVDFSEVSYRAIEALGDGEDDFGEALLEEDRIMHILVDEMQDTSLGQLHLINKLCSHWDGTDGRTIFLCGDPMQSIYLFRGANVNLFTGILDNLSVANQDLKLAVLEANFRSSPDIVNWVNDTFAPVIGDKSCQLSGTVKFENAVPQRANPGAVDVIGINGGGESEAEWIASDICAKTEGDDSIVILARTRRDLSSAAKALAARDITFSGQDVESLTESQDVQFLVALVRSLWHGGDRSSWFQLLRSPMVGLTWEDCISVARHSSIYDFVFDRSEHVILTDDGQRRIGNLALALAGANQSQDQGFISKVTVAWHLLRGPEIINPISLVDIQSVFDLLIDCCDGGQIRDIHEFNQKLNSLYASPKAGRVQLMTIHKSKGLEFDHVYLMGMGRKGRGADPKLFEWRRLFGGLTVVANPKILSSGDNDDRLYKFLTVLNQNELEHEVRRLLYVAATRSKQTLSLVGKVVEDGDGGYSPVSGSLFNVLWPHINHACTVIHGQNNEDEEAVMPYARRPEPTATSALDLEYFKPRPVEALNESILAEALDDEYQSLYERAVGVTYHLLAEMEIKNRAVTSKATISNLAPAVSTQLRRNGCPERDVAIATNQVLSLMESTLNCQNGRWILDAHSESASEVAYLMKTSGSLSRLVIDRLIETDDEVWIIDFKTGSPDNGLAQDLWINNQIQMYKSKMDAYASAIEGAGCTKSIKTALYYPGIQCLVELSAA